MFYRLDFLCGKCDKVHEDLILKTERGQLRDCPHCGEPESAKEIPSAPMIAKVSYRDGVDRGTTFNKAKEAAKLEVVRAGMRRDKRVEIDKEIKRLKEDK